MKTQFYTATSIDGFIADSDNSLDWLLQFGDGSGDAYDAFVSDVGAIAMGSTTYEWLLEHHVFADADDPKPWSYTQPVWVFSSRPQRPVDGADIRFVNGDVAAVHSEMSRVAAGKNIWIMGGGDLAGQFHDLGLLDEIILAVCPVSLGSGAALLPRRITHPPMRLVSATTDGPFAMLTYSI